jgi:hypothetical protein
VAKPDTDISAADLSAVVAGGGPIDRGQSGAPLIDERARDEYRRRPAHIASSRPPTAAATPTAAAERPRSVKLCSKLSGTPPAATGGRAG